MALSYEDQRFRRLVIDLDGCQADIAAALGVTLGAVSRRLRRTKHRSFWRRLKDERSKRRARERQARWRAGVHARSAPQLPADPYGELLMLCLQYL